MTYELSFELQKAIFHHIANDDSLSSLIDSSKIFDEPLLPGEGLSADKIFPYIVIGEEKVDPWGSFDVKGAEHSFQVVVFSEGRGFSEAKKIAAAVSKSLVDADTFVLDGGTLVNLVFLSGEASRDKKEDLRKVVMKFAAYMEVDNQE